MPAFVRCVWRFACEKFHKVLDSAARMDPSDPRGPSLAPNAPAPNPASAVAVGAGGTRDAVCDRARAVPAMSASGWTAVRDGAAVSCWSVFLGGGGAASTASYRRLMANSERRRRRAIGDEDETLAVRRSPASRRAVVAVRAGVVRCVVLCCSLDATRVAARDLASAWLAVGGAAPDVRDRARWWRARTSSRGGDSACWCDSPLSRCGRSCGAGARPAVGRRRSCRW